jgi:hypothetical protein
VSTPQFACKVRRKTYLTTFSCVAFPIRLNSFVSDWKQAQREKESQRGQEIMSHRAVLIEAGMPTAALIKILRSIFTQYLSDEQSCLGYIEASRLWYRCGLKLSSLKDIMDSKASDCDGKRDIEFYDFLGLIQRIIAEDSKHFVRCPSVERSPLCFEIGEKVELVEGYERFGDAANGPLLPGDRGSVIELQKVASDEMYVICSTIHATALASLHLTCPLLLQQYFDPDSS